MSQTMHPSQTVQLQPGFFKHHLSKHTLVIFHIAKFKDRLPLFHILQISKYEGSPDLLSGAHAHLLACLLGKMSPTYQPCTIENC